LGHLENLAYKIAMHINEDSSFDFRSLPKFYNQVPKEILRVGASSSIVQLDIA
jgi:hypothetical protein